MVDIQELSAKRPSRYYIESAKIRVSHDSNCYDEMITKPHIQAREKYERTSRYQLDQKIQQQEKDKKNCIIKEEQERAEYF